MVKAIFDWVSYNQNQSYHCGQSQDTDNPVNKSKLEANTSSWHEARENVRERVTIGFDFTSDWLRKWCEIFKPITQRSSAKPTQTRIMFDTQVKIALMGGGGGWKGLRTTNVNQFATCVIGVETSACLYTVGTVCHANLC